ncbi:hypothetical protein D3C76_242520 [compost metagenome]
MKKIKFCLMLLFVIMITFGCNSNKVNTGLPDTDKKEVMNLQGKSEHWKVDYLIRESETGSKYTLQCIISLLDQKEIIYNISYDINSPGGVSHLSGTMSSMDKNRKISILENDTISPSISTYALPPKGENIIITVIWNDNNEEQIIITP